MKRSGLPVKVAGVVVAHELEKRKAVRQLPGGVWKHEQHRDPRADPKISRAPNRTIAEERETQRES